MAIRIPEIHPISDLARDARALIERVRRRQEPIVITQRGREVAVLVPIELYRRMEGFAAHRLVSPRLVHPEDAAKFRVQMTEVEPSGEEADASL